MQTDPYVHLLVQMYAIDPSQEEGGRSAPHGRGHSGHANRDRKPQKTTQR